MSLPLRDTLSRFTVLMSLIIGITSGYLIHYRIGCRVTQFNSPVFCTLRTIFRKLWMDYVVWTNRYIISSVVHPEDLKFIKDRLNTNQEEFGSILTTYYGKNTGEAFTKLLKEQLDLLFTIIASLKSHEKGKFTQETERYLENIKGLAKFLNDINKYLIADDIIKLLNENLELTVKLINAILKKNWSEEITTFDTVMENSSLIADNFSEGIVKQFPDKF